MFNFLKRQYHYRMMLFYMYRSMLCDELLDRRTIDCNMTDVIKYSKYVKSRSIHHRDMWMKHMGENRKVW